MQSMDMSKVNLEEILAEIEKREKRWESASQILEELKESSEHRGTLLGNEFWQGIVNVVVREAQFYMNYQDPEKALEVRKRQATAEPSNVSYLQRLAEAYLDVGDENKVIEIATTAIQRMQRIKKRWEDKDRRYIPPKERGRELADIPDDKLLPLLVSHAFNQRFKRASEICAELARRDRLVFETKVLTIRLDEITSVTNEDAKLYQHIIIPKVIESGLPLELFTENRNKVHQLKWEGFPDAVIYAKEYSSSETQNAEFANTMLFRRYLGDSIQRVLATEPFGDSELTFFQAAGNKTLDDIIDEGNKRKIFRALKESARLLARIHVLGTLAYRRGPPPDLNIPDLCTKDVVTADPAYFTHKLETTLFSLGRDSPGFGLRESIKDNLREGHSAINFHLVRAERNFYKDHNPRNIIIDDFGMAVAIDFETAKMLPCQLDLVSLLEFGGIYITDRQKRTVIEEYTREKEQLMRYPIDRRNFMRTYRYAAAQRHLELIGYRTRDALSARDEKTCAAELRRREYHIIAAAHATRELRDMEPSPSKTPKFNMLHNVLKELPRPSL